MANAMIKNVSHKNCTDEGENWLVRLYYTNKIFFVIMACGADNGLVLAFINGRQPLENQWLVMIAATIIVMK